MHRNLHRIAVHQCLDALRLVSTGQLIGCVNIYFDLAAGRLLHELAKLTSRLCPGACLGCGTRKVPGHIRPIQIAVIADRVEIVIVCLGGSAVASDCLVIFNGCRTSQCRRQTGRNLRNICNYQ